MGEDNFAAMLDFVRGLTEELHKGNSLNRFAMITFSTDVNLVFSFGRYYEAAAVSAAVSNVRYTPGSTNTAGGLRSAYQILQEGYGARREADDVVVLITDGESNINAYDTVPASDSLKTSGAHIIGIGVGLKDTTEIDQIASSPGEVFQARNFESLKNIKLDILSNACAQG